MPGCWTCDSAHKDGDVLQTRVTNITNKDHALLTAKLYPPYDPKALAHLPQSSWRTCSIVKCQIIIQNHATDSTTTSQHAGHEERNVEFGLPRNEAARPLHYTFNAKSPFVLGMPWLLRS